MATIGGIGNRDRKGHGGSEWSEMTGKSGKWAIVVVTDSRREVGGGCSHWSEMMRCLRSWSHLSRRIGRGMVECLLRHWSRLIEGGGKLERSHGH